MFTVCLRYSPNREEAKDLLQEGFVKVFDSLHQFRFEGSFEGWMKKVMVNQALQKIRGKTHLHALLPVHEVIDPEGISDRGIIARLGAKELLQLVQELPTTYRLVFNLYVFEGCPHKEIASLLRISEGTSKSNLHDARKWLQEKIKLFNNDSYPKRKCL